MRTNPLKPSTLDPCPKRRLNREMKRLFLFLFYFWSCLFSQSNEKPDDSLSKSETAAEPNLLSEKLTPKAARQFLAEDIGRWKVKVTERTEGNPPKTHDDIMVVHQITNSANGTRDAVMYVFTKTDGMLTRVETGATPLPPKE